MSLDCLLCPTNSLIKKNIQVAMIRNCTVSETENLSATIWMDEVLFKQKHIFWFQLLKCKYLPIFLVFHDCKLNGFF